MQLIHLLEVVQDRRSYANDKGYTAPGKAGKRENEGMLPPMVMALCSW